jgi:hypothetical protein
VRKYTFDLLLQRVQVYQTAFDCCSKHVQTALEQKNNPLGMILAGFLSFLVKNLYFFGEKQQFK